MKTRIRNLAVFTALCIATAVHASGSSQSPRRWRLSDPQKGTFGYINVYVNSDSAGNTIVHIAISPLSKMPMRTRDVRIVPFDASGRELRQWPIGSPPPKLMIGVHNGGYRTAYTVEGPIAGVATVRVTYKGETFVLKLHDEPPPKPMEQFPYTPQPLPPRC